jgi:hypothetical protein
MWMRKQLGLWSGSQLAKYFHDKGIHHADDMSGIILDSYHRYLTKREVKLEEQSHITRLTGKKQKKKKMKDAERKSKNIM